MCFTRGNAYLHLNDVQAAKVCFIEALKVDVKCYDVSTHFYFIFLFLIYMKVDEIELN